MTVRASVGLGALLLLAACGSRTGLAEPELPSHEDAGLDLPTSVDAPGRPDIPFDDGGLVDVARDAPASDIAPVGCTLRLLDGPTPAISHDGSNKGPWIAPSVVFRDGAFDAVATLLAEVDDTFSQTRAMRFRYTPGAGFRVEVAPRVLFAASGPTPVTAQDEALALCRWPGAGGMAAEIVRYRGLYERLAESRSYVGATGCAGLAAASDTLLMATQIVVRSGLPEVWLARSNRAGSGIEALGPALLEMPREGVGVALIAHPDGRRYHLASAVRPGGFVELGEVDAPSMGMVRRRRVAGFSYSAAVEGVAPALAFWPDGDTLAMVFPTRVGTHRLERVRLSDGMRSAIDLGTSARAGSAPPALLVTPQGHLLVAILHGNDVAPATSQLELVVVDTRAEAVTSRLRVPIPGAAPRGIATGVSVASDGDHVVVHWSGATPMPQQVRQTFLAAFDCQ